ncbi:Methyltransferase [Alloactinosynnema sp. L-07]|uniref:class I SAM-dependent methyltransferase n=1 Tax=Alloactinosynnema sp. L-07 TaxID=1653480 RepID=UPI00065EFF4E|nr:class I SAM-dependent methyltransferase [Alloactinosynnema sp. L-07]CRK61286.1 Methyltransferase [Alloactinosynnema sp. L-07]
MTDEDQTARWNGRAGNAWVDSQELLDKLLKPVEDVLVDAVAGPAVLDVGCGTGGTTVAVARKVGTCVGVDISGSMIAAAEKRAELAGVRATFIRADAQDHDFEPGTFDTVISRFGVMFFADPVRAFTNLRRATRGGLCVVVWRGMDENPFMTTAERAAAPLLTLPVRLPDTPGQFGMASPDLVRGILTESGWADVDLEPLDVDFALPESELVGYFTRLGPLGLALPEVDETTRERVVETVRPAFDPYVHGAEVRFNGACWIVRATKGS